MADDEREILTWQQFGDASRALAQDVADTGKTLDLVHGVIDTHVAEARTAVLYHKPQSVIVPDYVWRSTERWIDFPWSDRPPVERRVVTNG